VFARVPHTITRQLMRFPGAGGDDLKHFSERLWVTDDAEGVNFHTNAAADESLVATQRVGSALLFRAHPHAWRLLVSLGDSGSLETVAELPEAPKARDLIELLEPVVKARAKAIESALRVLRQGGDATNGESGRGANAGGGDGDRNSEDGNADGTAELRAGGTNGAQAMTTALARPLSAAGGLGVASRGACTSNEILCFRFEEIISAAGEALSLYQAGTVLRQRCYGGAISYRHDEAALHLWQPFSAEEAIDARARSLASGRLNGDLRGCVLLRPDGAAKGICAIEQLSLQRDLTPKQRSSCAAALLGRALTEARACQQHAAVLPALPAVLRVEGAEWLASSGFVGADKAPDDVRRAMGDGAAYRML